MPGIFSGPCEFTAGAAHAGQMPEANLPEIAFAGRSNVGKSSLINALTGRKTLARVSHTPGRTQQINFFRLGDALGLVDMPGYGYAKVSKAQREAWENLIRAYLRGRQTLRCVFLLIDGRHGLKSGDDDVMIMLDECAVPYRILLTKADKAADNDRTAIAADIEAVLKKHPAAFPHPQFVSAHEKEGIEELRSLVIGIAGS